MSTWSVTPSPVPPSLEDPAAWALHGASAVSFAVDHDTYGNQDVAYTAQYLHVGLTRTEYTARVLLVAHRSDLTSPTAQDVVGLAHLHMQRASNERMAYLELVVHPEHRRQGVGAALLAEAEQVARAHGRSVVIANSDHRGEPPADSPGALEAPTGSGRIDSAEPGAVFAHRHGFVLEQAERYSVLELPVDPELLDRMHAEAADRAGTDYRLHAWRDHLPEEWLEHFAVLETRMSTDAPSAGLEIEEDVWDAARVRAAEERIAAAGHAFLVVATEHVPTGALAAFTMVEMPHDRPAVVFQEDTLVLREHRGRRLGMLVKADMLRRLAVSHPAAERVHTWNAEENSYMLAINVALGFRPTGVSGEWQKHLT